MSDKKHFILKEYKEYEAAVYPKGVDPRQNAECEQAFVMGGFVCLNHIISQMEKSPNEVEETSMQLYEFFHNYKDKKLKQAMVKSIDRSESD